MKPISCIQSFIVFTLPGITVSRTVHPPLSPLLVSGLHHHLTIGAIQSPLTSILLEYTITADGRTDVPITRRNHDTLTRFQPPFQPHPERPDIAYLLYLFRLFSSSFRFSNRFISSARRPASSFNLFTAESKSSSPASGLLQAIYRFLFPFST